MKKLLNLFIIVGFLFTSVISSGYTIAQETTVTPTPTTGPSSAARSEIERKIREYEAKLSEVRNQKNTLSSQISYMDTQIFLTELKAEETKKEESESKFEKILEKVEESKPIVSIQNKPETKKKASVKKEVNKDDSQIGMF